MRVPSEQELINRYGVARETVRDAMDRLLAEGVVRTGHGRGSFVRDRPPVRRLAHDRFARRHRERGQAAYLAELEAEGRRPEVQLLAIARVAAPDEVAVWLQLVIGADVFIRRRRPSPDQIASPRRAKLVEGALRQSERMQYRGPHRVARELAVLGAFVAACALAAPPALAAPNVRRGAGQRRRRGQAERAPGVAGRLLGAHAAVEFGAGTAAQEPWLDRAPRAPWLLVLRAAPDRMGRCWLQVRLPSRPNDAAAWFNADRVVLRSTPWRLVVSRRARSISVYRDGERLRRFRVVVGAPVTPSPLGLFSIVGVWRWDPADFLGSYVLALTGSQQRASGVRWR